MLFFKRTFPVIIAFLMGVAFAAQYYIPHPLSEGMLTEVVVWDRIIAGLAFALGVASLCHLHYVRVRRKVPGWGYSLVLYLAMIATVIAGLWASGEEKGTLFGWIYNNVFVPLNSTMFSILAFFIASAAYRAFRARTREATVLLVAAALVMFGRAPFGEYLIPGVGILSDWIMNVLNTAAKRAILIGISLGVIATSIKIIVGIERAYLGGRE